MRDIENTKQHLGFPIKDFETLNEIEFGIQQHVICIFKSTMLMALT